MRSRVFISIVVLAGLSLVLGSCLDTNNVSYFQQMQEDIAEIDAFLDSHPPVDPTDIVLKDNYSGIRLVITERGTGAIPPTTQNVIEVSYRGKLLSKGDTVNSNGDPLVFDQGDSFVFTLDPDDGVNPSDVINGWKFALTMMTEGTKATVFIPSGLAYGTRGSGSIPKNAILAFDLELRTVLKSDQEPRFTTDKSAISAALEAVPNVVEDPSGISYILQPGVGGLTPSLYDQVRFRYAIKKLDGTVLKESVEEGPRIDFSSFLVNHPHGLIIGLQKMNEGDRASIYTPSVLAYGVNGAGAVSANMNVIFEVELLQVIPYGQ